MYKEWYVALCYEKVGNPWSKVILLAWIWFQFRGETESVTGNVRTNSCMFIEWLPFFLPWWDTFVTLQVWKIESYYFNNCLVLALKYFFLELSVQFVSTQKGIFNEFSNFFEVFDCFILSQMCMTLLYVKTN